MMARCTMWGWSWKITVIGMRTRTVAANWPSGHGHGTHLWMHTGRNRANSSKMVSAVCRIRERFTRMTGTLSMCNIAEPREKMTPSHRPDAVLAQARLAALVENCDDAIIGKTLDGIIT